MNLSDLQSECSRLLSDTGNGRWPLTTLTTRINLAQEIIQGQTNAIKTVGTFSLVANTATIVITTAATDLLEVNIQNSGGEILPLKGKTLTELDFSTPSWRQFNPSTPVWFMWDGTTSTITLVPTPDYSLVGGLITLLSVRPDDLVNPTDVPFNANPSFLSFHLSIVHWVVAQCFMDDGTPEALAKAKFHKSGNMLNPGEYEKQIGRIMAEFDVPEAVPNRVLWRPQGGRLGYAYWPAKSNPFIW